MKVVLLAGGFGTRISEESYLKPKPMIEIGGMPILWHIMKLYSHYGFNDFIICAGYKQEIIKEWFDDYYIHNCDVTFDLANNKVEIHENHSEPWKVTVVDTGWNTMTGGRIKRVQKYIGNEQFLLSYGDGVSDVNIPEVIKFHNRHDGIVTMTAVDVTQRFGVLNINDDGTLNFREKNVTDKGTINGGFMVIEPEIFDYIDGDDTVFERDVLEKLSSEHKMMAYRHTGFWQCMDTQSDKNKLELMYSEGKAPWVLW